MTGACTELTALEQLAGSDPLTGLADRGARDKHQGRNRRVVETAGLRPRSRRTRSG